MKKKEAATLNVSRTLVLCVAIISIPLLLATFIPPVSGTTILFALYVLAGILVAGFLADHFARARITLTDSEVRLRIRRSGETVVLPWTNFTCLYNLTSSKMSIYLLTPAPMNKAAQLATYKAGCKNRDIPSPHEGGLMLNAYVHGSVIDQYIPANIQKITGHQCTKL